MIYLIIFVGVFLLDFAIKRKIEEDKTLGQEDATSGGTMKPKTVAERKKAGGWILVRKLHNYGIAGGGLGQHSLWVKRITGLLLGGMGIHFLMLLFQKGNRGLKLAYSLILGGGLSNFVDRCTKGYVTDYFSFNVPWKKLKRLVFNLSDMFIMLGSVILCLSQFKGKE